MRSLNKIEPLFDKQCTCLLCQTKFTTKKLRSRFVKLIKMDTDFFPVYAEHNPLLYYINVCPACGFSYNDDTIPYFSPESKMSLLEKVSSHWIPHSFGKERSIEDSIKTYKLAAYCASIRKEKHITLAGLYLRIAWHYRLLNNTEQERRFINLALSEYETSYSVGDYQGTQVTELRTIYLIADLSKRTNNLEQATKYYSKVIEQQKRTVETQIVKLAKESWQEIRDSHKSLI
ncbi:DUF2225 domain-containing protein [Niallia sp. FSL W8-0635]|uniref:DUF2225 domain-containing protein n=1 Tax=Niallia sp. FSL W8-0635 TaxID=2975337 RepID=UPI0030FB561A